MSTKSWELHVCDDGHSAALPCRVREVFQDAAPTGVHVENDQMGLPVVWQRDIESRRVLASAVCTMITDLESLAS